MIAQWIWLGLAVITLGGNIATGFRPLLSLAGGFLAAGTAAGRQWPGWSQFLVFLAVAVVLEAGLKLLSRRSRRQRVDPQALAIVGKTGKVQDVVNREKDIFLLHAAGKDWLAVPQLPRTIDLGDMVRVVAVSGKRVVVGNQSTNPD